MHCADRLLTPRASLQRCMVHVLTQLGQLVLLLAMQDAPEASKAGKAG